MTYKTTRTVKFLLIILFLPILANAQRSNSTNLNDSILFLGDNGGWCWFQDDRAIIDQNQLLFTGVTSEGANMVYSYNFSTGKRNAVVLNDKDFEPDDHNVGVLLVRPDGRYLAVYAGHGETQKMHYRISANPGDITKWNPEQTAATGGGTTYSNVYRLSSTQKTYNFHRGIGRDPNYMISEDDGETWSYGGRLFSFNGRPYVRYASNDVDRVHFITTEDHPRHYNNSIYHGFLQGEELYTSDGKKVDSLSTSRNTPLTPQSFTRVYNGNSENRTNVAWTSDIALDSNDNPYIAFSVTKDPIALGETKNTEQGGFDHRYHYARWDGQQWHENEIAYAGTRLYAGENEYTGLITLHPENPNVVYISSDVHPATGEPLITGGVPVYEIFKGTTTDRGYNWRWTSITKNSTQDNIRPIVVANESYEAVIWLTGTYSTWEKYDLKVYGLIKHK